MKLLKDDLKNLKIPIIIIAIYCVIMQTMYGTVCPLKAFTGISCPACGLTHATIYLITGQFEKALQSNSTVIFWWISIILFCIDRYLYKLKVNVFPTCFIITSIITLMLYFSNISVLIINL